MLRGRSGFTFIELLVVISIIAILGAMILPLALQAKVAAMKTSCLGNLKQLGAAMRLYQQDFAGDFPSSSVYPGQPAGYSSWVFWISSYVKNRDVLNCPAATGPWEAAYGREIIKVGYSYNEYINYRHYQFTSESVIRLPSQVLLLADGYKYSLVHDRSDGYKYSLVHDWSDGDVVDQMDGLPSGMNRVRFADMRVTADGREIPMVRHGGPNVMFCDMHARQIPARSFRAADYPGYRYPSSCREWPLMYPAAIRYLPPPVGGNPPLDSQPSE